MDHGIIIFTHNASSRPSILYRPSLQRSGGGVVLSLTIYALFARHHGTYALLCICSANGRVFCQVTPNSAIYFYQFSTPADPAAVTWTTRFTIAGADGSTVPPENDLEPDGQPIPWGVGALVDPSTAVAAPSYLGGAGSTGTGSTGTPGTTPDVPATDPTTTPSSPGAPAPSSNSNPGLAPPAPTTSNTGLNTSPTTNTTGAGAENENGALRAFGVDSYLARAGLALGVAAFSFAVAL